MNLFTSRKLSLELGRYIRRICDQTIPNHASAGLHGRRGERLNRCIPTLICPWENRAPVVDETGFALTANLSNNGVGLLVNQPLHVRELLLGYWIDPEDTGQPWYFLGEIRHQERSGGGFWSLGVELTEFVNQRHPESVEELNPLAARLLPPMLVAVGV